LGVKKTFKAILKVLSKPEKESMLVLHGHSGAGKSELARRRADNHPGKVFGEYTAWRIGKF
jgi:tRNA A37 threonylcarbamoyladenosine biosynthesis protein TsaE